MKQITKPSFTYRVHILLPYLVESDYFSTHNVLFTLGTRECKDLVIDVKCDHRNSRPSRDLSELSRYVNLNIYSEEIISLFSC